MDGEWNEVKAKPKKKKAPKTEENKPVYGGKKAGGKLVAGPIKKANAGGGGGYNEYEDDYGYGNTDYSALNNQASNIADFDYHIDSDEEVKFEIVSHACAQGVSEARLKANMTQTQLAAAIGEKVGVIHDIENGTGRYQANVINNIENVLKCKIPRGRGKKKGKK